jgi:GT2 family glycosyltransferase
MPDSIAPVSQGPHCSSLLCAVVVTRNRLQLLQECIAAIRVQTCAVSQILVVDNGSSDGTQKWLQSQPDIWVIRQSNGGSAGGFHRGLKEAVAGSEYGAIWLMDDDVVPQLEALSELHAAAQVVPDYGFLASRVVGVDGLPMNVPNLEMSPLKNGSPAWPVLAQRGLLKVRSATFVSLLIPARVVAAVGLPLSEMFIWGDDIEYTRRISVSHPCFWVPRSEVVHKRANQTNLCVVKETDPSRISMFRFYFRNSMFVVLRHRDGKELLRLLYVSVNQSVRSLFTHHAIKKVRAIWSGLLAGFFFAPSTRSTPEQDENAETQSVTTAVRGSLAAVMTPKQTSASASRDA